ncbi:G protein-coupled receptor rhodopsin-like [Trinorchestia longiramus]|nr:G protein-coupled receptor rhodopsin-like [Trinorchestia longiramus]
MEDNRPTSTAQSRMNSSLDFDSLSAYGSTEASPDVALQLDDSFTSETNGANNTARLRDPNDTTLSLTLGYVTPSLSLDNTTPTLSLDNATPSLSLPAHIRWVSTSVIAVVLVVGVVGNLLVPAVVLRGKRSTPVYFMTNLAVAHLLVLVLCLPTVLVELQTTPEAWVLGPALCKVRPFVEYSAVHGSALSLVVVSLERYLVVCRPLQAPSRMTSRTCLSAIAVCWCTALLSSGPILWIQHSRDAMFLDGVRRPVCVTDLKPLWTRLYYVSIAMLFFFVPLLLLVLLYGAMAATLLQDTSHLGIAGPNPHLRTRRQLVLTLALVVFFFFFCLLPLRIFLLWILASPHEDILALGMEGYYTLLYFCRVMFYLNSAINPVLYNMTSKRFRAAFVTICCVRSDRRPLNSDFFTSFSKREANCPDVGVPLRGNEAVETNQHRGKTLNGRPSNDTKLCLTPTAMRTTRYISNHQR